MAAHSSWKRRRLRTASKPLVRRRSNSCPVQVVLRNPAGFEAIDDLTALRFLDAPNLLHSLALRFKEDKIYTYTGRSALSTGRAIKNWPATHTAFAFRADSHRDEPMEVPTGPIQRR